VRERPGSADTGEINRRRKKKTVLLRGGVNPSTKGEFVVGLLGLLKKGKLSTKGH